MKKEEGRRKRRDGEEDDWWSGYKLKTYQRIYQQNISISQFVDNYESNN